MSEIRIQREDFDPGAEIAALNTTTGEIGAIASFIGLVRGDDGMEAMTLDHYPGFAEREIAAHVGEAEKRCHRQAAFAAAEFLMDYLKTRAPFWKLEERKSGAIWVEARESDDESVTRWR